MKIYSYKVGVALTLSLAFIYSSCSDKLQEDGVGFREKVALEVSVDGVTPTRSIVSGTTLPDDSFFYVYYKSDQSAIVNYKNGVCIFEKPIYLDENSGNDPVYAIYPYGSSQNTVGITYSIQNDYMKAVGLNENGVQTNPSIDNPKVRFHFEHILARITLNIHKDATISDYYKLSDVYLGGDSENSYRLGTYDFVNDKFTYTSTFEYQDIKGELKDGNYLLETADDIVTVDFLVIPSATTWSVKLSGLSSSWWTLPAGNYESGKQYIYDCLISDNNYVNLSIRECEILPWESTEMPGIDGY